MIAAPSSKRPVSVLREELTRHAPQYRKVLLFSIITNLLALAPTIFMLEVYGRVVTSRSEITLVMLLIMVVGVYVMMEALELVRSGIMSRAGLQVDEALRARLFDTTFQMNLRRGGGASTQTFSDLRTIREFMSSPGLMAVLDAPASLVFLAIKFFIHPLLGFTALLGAVAQVIIAYRTEKRIMPALTEANKAAISAQGYASASLRNTQVIEAMGMMGSIRTRWMTMQRRFLQLQADASDHSGLNNAAGRFLQMMLGSLILGLSCWIHLNGGLWGGSGMMIVASVLGGRVLAPLIQLVAQWRGVVNARDAYARLDGLLSAIAPEDATMSLPPPKGRLTVEGVVVPAPGSPFPILKGVGFALQPGELLVVVGPSAAGKTTLARVLTGVWPTNGGKVRLDGADVFAWNKEELGPHVGYLPQGVELFEGTLAENIARFGKVDRDKVNAAADMVGLAPFVATLAQGLDTRIGEEGSFLSGGQRQRVGLARALYGMPRFLVLDEPNSSLDDAGEVALIDTLRQVKAAGSTTVVISHRSNVLQVADRMLVLRDGQVAAFGPRDEVLAGLQKAAAQAAAGQGAGPGGAQQPQLQMQASGPGQAPGPQQGSPQRPPQRPPQGSPPPAPRPSPAGPDDTSRPIITRIVPKGAV